MGAHLVTMPSYEEVEKVAKMLDDATNYWIGGHCKGCKRDDLYEEKWEWITGEKIPLSNIYWRKYSGCAGSRTETPCDNDGTAHMLTLKRDDKEKNILFVNASTGEWNSHKFIC